ncbi:MAG: hypothetical protein NZ889_00920 [Candidatus Pacearchaeota archaeon]|nr:hypothetical protein [Candidatus Pacearchaeota archaeon]
MKKIIIFTFLLSLALLLGGCKFPFRQDAQDIKECILDTDCVKVQVTCCPCSAGGKEECVSAAAKPVYDKILSECSPNVICPQVYNCKIQKCVCKRNRCRAIIE